MAEKRRWWVRLVRTLGAAVLLAAALPPLSYGLVLAMRPSRKEVTRELFVGVSYRREVHSSPRLMVIHSARIDLTAPGIRALVTPGDSSKGMDIIARTTSDFLERNGLQLAINGSFCKPAYHHGLFDYYPKKGDPVEVIGLAISDGITYSQAEGTMPALCLSEHNEARIQRGGCLEGTRQALAGHPVLLEDGRNVAGPDTPVEPRTAVAVDREGETLWFIVVDGRQKGYSEGATFSELAEIASSLGADDAMNLDGGGSSTMVISGWLGPHILNSPIHTRLPSRERPVANHLGISARALP